MSNNYRFLQLHLLTAYGPANLNRDDLGKPKSAVFGNAPRLRISSQSLKRSWRTSDLFAQHLDEKNLGTRTKRLGVEAFEEMIQAGLDEKNAKEWSKLIAQAFGKLKTEEEDAPAEADGGKAKGKKKAEPSNEVETLVFVSHEEREAALALARTIAKSKKAPSDDQLNFLRKNNECADLALFGRMLTSDKSRAKETSDRPLYNVEAAAQIAHAITTHRATVEDDFFSAVDDLNRAEDTGSGHLGEVGFGAGVFYLYACVDRELLISNLNGNKALAAKTLSALAACMTQVAPTGKQNSFASRARASFGLAELGNEAPRQLTAAFLKPVNEQGDHDVMALSAERMLKLVERFDSAYGFDGKRMHFNATEFQSNDSKSVKDVLAFTASDLG
jgi:CRISPR system Cascade subunit CasC